MLKFNKNENRFCLDTYVIRDKNCIGYCCESPKNLYKKIKIASEAGYDSVELWHKDVFEFKKKFGLHEIIKLCKDNKISVDSYKVVEDWFNISSNLEKINEVIETASSIGSKSIVVKLLNDNEIHMKNSISFFTEKYLKLIEKCSHFNIRPSIEFMALSNYMNSIDDVYNILEKTKGNLVLDTWHLWRNDGVDFNKFEKTINRLDPKWISVIHFTDACSEVERKSQKDGDRKMPGLGCLNLKKFCSLMKKIKFTGTYSLNVYDRSLWNEEPLKVATQGMHLMKSYFIERNLLDSENWEENQKIRCEGLWNKNYYTHLDPRVSKSNRDEKLKKILEPIIINKKVLDFKCGFSPLAHYVSYGFDAFEDCIKYLKNKFPNAEWTCCSDKQFSKNFNKKIDVLMHIGLGDSLTEVDSHLLIRKKCKPNIIIIECASDSSGNVDESKKGNIERWNILAKDLKNIKSFSYTTNMEERKNRLILVGEI